jgi:hypothetical protein
MTQTFEAGSRPTFRERVHALAGHSTWREPSHPGSVDARRTIPTDHLIAAALSFGRRGPDDIGPDIAYDIATGRMGHHRRVCLALGRALAGDRGAIVRRNQAFIAVVAWAGYSAVVGLGAVPKPAGCTQDDWDALVPESSPTCLPHFHVNGQRHITIVLEPSVVEVITGPLDRFP